jgi:hypothetical protein
MPPPHVKKRLKSDSLYYILAHKDIVATAEWIHAVDKQKKLQVKKEDAEAEKEKTEKEGEVTD